MIDAKKVSKFHQENCSKTQKNFSEIALLLAWNFRNNFKPNDRQNFSKNADFWKAGHIFFSKIFPGSISAHKMKVLRK